MKHHFGLKINHQGGEKKSKWNPKKNFLQRADAIFTALRAERRAPAHEPRQFRRAQVNLKVDWSEEKNKVWRL